MVLHLRSQVSRFMLRKNDSYFLFSFTNFKIVLLCCNRQVIVSWLIAFNVLNTQNRFVYAILELSYKLTEPFLNKIRHFLPNLGSLDISPIILLLLIWFIEMCMKLYIAPMIF